MPLLWLVLACLLCCGADQTSDESHSDEDRGYRPHPQVVKAADPSDPLRADIVCRARCLAKCRVYDSSAMSEADGVCTCSYYNQTWLSEICTTVSCQASCGNLTQETDQEIEKPSLHDVVLANNKLVLTWESVNCTACQWSQCCMSIVRYSSHLEEWKYEIIQTDNSTFSLDLQDVCARYFQVGMANQYGVSPTSDMKILEPIQVFKGRNVTPVVEKPSIGPYLTLNLPWEVVSGWIPDIVFYLEMLGDPQCAKSAMNPHTTQWTNRTKIANKVANVDQELARGNCDVSYQVVGTFGVCYHIEPVSFNYSYDCNKLLGDETGCQIHVSTPKVNHRTVSVTVFSNNRTVKVEWEAVGPSPSAHVYGYCVQWGKLDKKLAPFMQLERGTTVNVSVPGVESNSVWIKGLETETQYGVAVVVNVSGVEPNLQMPHITEFELEEVTTSPPTDLISTAVPVVAMTSLTIPITVVVCCLFVGAMATLGKVFLRTCRRHQKASRLSKSRLRRDEESMPNVYSITPAVDSPDPPVPDRWEIPFDRLEMGAMLGKGQFGIVMKAFIAGKLSTHYTSGSSLFRDSIKRYDVQVAVKMLHDDAEDSQRQEFRHEMKLMKDIGRHSNLVSLLGCCSTDAAPLCLIVEHCCHGDLLKYLRANRGLMMRNEKDEKSDETDVDSLTPNDLLSFGRQIARGMEYLSQKGFVHRDLAARNVMVAEDKTVKIGDFGLTRYVYDDNIYVHRRGGKLPIKWMSVEALHDQVFTTFNDVWSFGVLLFELVTLGASPYPGIHNKDIPNMLKRGDRMQRPENCSQVLYAIMIACWHPCPHERPTFTHLRNKLEALLEEDTPYLNFNQNYSYFPFFEISEELESEEEEVGEGREESGARPDLIPMVSMESGDTITLGKTPSTDDEVFVEIECSQPMLGTGEVGTSHSLDDVKDTSRGLQKRDSGLGSDYLYSSRHANMEDIPLV